MLTITNNVCISGKEFAYECPWDGRRLELSPACPYLAFDTETEVVDLTRHIPRLALASASTGRRHVLMRPDQVGEFILKHADARFVFHNAAFDFWVVDRHLADRNEQHARRAWRDACHTNRMHDTMLLDALIRLAQGRAVKQGGSNDWLPLRDLAEVAQEYTSLRISKEDPYRKRYAEILGKDWSEVDDGFFEYAIKDPIVTLRAYQGMSDRAEWLMLEGGYDRTLAPTDKHLIHPDAIRTFGLLSESVQVKGAVALAQVTRNGMRLDAERAGLLQAEYRRRLNEVIETLRREYPRVIKLDRNGGIKLNATSLTPAVNENELRELLVQAVEEVRTQTGCTIKVPRTPKGKVSTSAKHWEQHADKHPLFRLWAEREKVSKLCEFFRWLRGDEVHPSYNVLLRTGRTSCTKPNIQQVPREGGFRELFVASPGHLLLAIDYSYIELRTLAAVCEARFGKSKLADTIRQGIDPHCYTAAMMLGVPLAEFMTWKDTPEKAKAFKQARQNAKAVNFGVPGGLGAASLVEYARATYKVDMDQQQATAKRHRLITEIYPELNERDGYLADGGMTRLACHLNAKVEDCWRKLDWRGTWDNRVVRGVQNVVRGKLFKGDGTPYQERYLRNIWDALNELNRNGDPRLNELLEGREGSEELYRLLFRQDVVTLTGRIRGGVEYTQARNTPFQSLAADGAKLALWELLYRGFRVIGFVHDELLVELPDEGGYVSLSTCEEVKRIVCEAMARVTGAVPIDADYTVSRCWSKDAKKLVQGDKVLAWEPDEQKNVG